MLHGAGISTYIKTPNMTLDKQENIPAPWFAAGFSFFVGYVPSGKLT